MVDISSKELREKVKEVYKKVAESPNEKFHFEVGRILTEKLGYPAVDLDKIPKKAIDSFAGVGYHFDLAAIGKGDKVLDLGSGSGTDVFAAALKAGEVIGIDMTDEQLNKAKKLTKEAKFENVSFKKAYIEELPFKNETFDVVISNGVINLSSEKESVFKEIARVLKIGGKMAISDIVSEKQLSEGITCDLNNWASCIGGAMQEDAYKKLIENSGMKIVKIKKNSQYQFLSRSAQGATKDYGIKSISLLARK
ncbi:MAG: methyltransferase domain-containing protein [Nanoarchaeota archaeon]